MGGQFHDLFASYLSNRCQAVSVNGYLNDLRPLVTGVPQGSVLNAILFLLFINDMQNLTL